MAYRERRSRKSKFRLGTITPLLDKNDKYIFVGDKVRYGEYTGRILPNDGLLCLMLDYSMWYGDNEYDAQSYGKCIDVPIDNGGKMITEIVEPLQNQ